MTAYLTTPQLRAALVAEVTNDHALLEVLQLIQWSFKECTVSGDALTTAILAIDGHLSYGD